MTTDVLAEDGAMVTVDVGLAYRDDTFSEWTQMAHSFENRKLNCNFTTAKVGERFHCHLSFALFIPCKYATQECFSKNDFDS